MGIQGFAKVRIGDDAYGGNALFATNDIAQNELIGVCECLSLPLSLSLSLSPSLALSLARFLSLTPSLCPALALSSSISFMEAMLFLLPQILLEMS